MYLVLYKKVCYNKRTFFIWGKGFMKKYLLVLLFVFFMFFVSLNNIKALNTLDVKVPEFNISNESVNCRQILGENLTNVVHFSIKLLRLAGAVIVIVHAMIILVPPITSKDADSLNKALKKCVNLSVILIVIFIFPSVINLLGRALEFDISCIF